MDSMDKTIGKGGFQLHVGDDYDGMSRAAADCVGERITQKSDLLLCAATGGSPTGMYAGLAESAKRDPGRFSRLRVIKLDEWGGLAMDNPATCEAYIQEHVVGPMSISADRYTAFQSDAADPGSECERVSRWLTANGPIDICVLGLGANGHLALNEPGDSLCPFAHQAVLSERSKQHAMLDVAGGAVDYGLTLGMAEILAARMIVFVVNGAHKRDLFETFARGEITTQFPASLLWLHPNVKCFCDRGALSAEAESLLHARVR